MDSLDEAREVSADAESLHPFEIPELPDAGLTPRDTPSDGGEPQERRAASTAVLVRVQGAATVHPAAQPPSPSPAELGSRQAERSEGASGWSVKEFLDGIEEQQDAPTGILAEWLLRMRPPESAGTEFEYAKDLAQDLRRIEQLLAQHDSNGQSITTRLAQAIFNQLQVLRDQEVATAAELNDKFVAQGGGALEFGKRELYDAGLAARIGPLDDRNPLAAMHTEHNEENYSSDTFTAGNYGIETSAIREWRAGAGEWAKSKDSFGLIQGFQIPGETKNIDPAHRRQMVCLEEFMRPPADAAEEKGAAWLEGLPQTE